MSSHIYMSITVLRKSILLANGQNQFEHRLTPQPLNVERECYHLTYIGVLYEAEIEHRYKNNQWCALIKIYRHKET